jgi:ABC-type transporter lipoprotein component MlaA
MLQIKKDEQKPPTTFKFNHLWLKEEGFRDMVIQNRRRYNPSIVESAMFQFTANLRKVKKVVAKWAGRKAKEAQKTC